MKRVLVVDDQRPVADMLLAVLREEGFDVQVCVAADEASQQALIYQPHLVILDLVMPQRSGADVLRELRSRHETAHIPILLVTAFPSAQKHVAANHEDGVQFMNKPFDIDELTERVRQMVGE
jgi:DNA-binding response OmpR family regulator